MEETRGPHPQLPSGAGQQVTPRIRVVSTGLLHVRLLFLATLLLSYKQFCGMQFVSVDHNFFVSQQVMNFSILVSLLTWKDVIVIHFLFLVSLPTLEGSSSSSFCLEWWLLVLWNGPITSILEVRQY